MFEMTDRQFDFFIDAIIQIVKDSRNKNEIVVKLEELKKNKA